MATASEPTAEPPANPSSPAFRAAQYVRMSTEHQQYSTHNQADKIQEYAERRNIQIVRTYADEGKSGLSIDGRASLQRLIADVESGNTDFNLILVYDVSRWGRFQDADESAYYEYICKRTSRPCPPNAAACRASSSTRPRHCPVPPPTSSALAA